MEKIHFRIDGRLAQLLGRQSIFNEVMAVFELCKNGYDADATKVDVFFEELQSGRGRIRIVDNGNGMSLDDIKNKFMVVATSSRVRKTITPGGRVVVGEKGIGRFAMERLSHKVTVYSYPKDESKAYKITIDWDRYEIDGVTFTEVGNELEEFSKTEQNRHGVEIVAESLRDQWTEKIIRKVDHHLGKLVAPEEFSEKLPFEISLTAPEFGIEGRAVGTGFFKNAPYELIGKILPDGKTHLIIKYKGKKIIGQGIKHQFCDDGRLPDIQTRCGPIEYHMWGFPFDIPGEEKWETWYGKRFVANIREWIKTNQGTRIYRDGFRVMPYGEPDNDWTNRDHNARMQSGALPKRNLIGTVKISQKGNPLLIPSSTRFHLIEDDDGPFSDLRDFVILCDKVLDRILHDERVKEFKKVTKNIPLQLEKTAKKIRGMKALPTPIKANLSREITQTVTYLRDEGKEREKKEERLMSKLEAYRDLASLGITTGLVAHEISHDLANLVALSEYFERGLKKDKLTKKDLFELHSNLSSSVRFIRDYMTLVRNFTVTLKSDQMEFRKKIVLNVKKEIEFYRNQMITFLQRHNIRFLIVIPEGLELYMYRADFQSILFNLLSNSIKSIIRRRNSLNTIERTKMENTIKVSLDPNPSINYSGLIFSDDGTGMRPSIQDRIFDIFFSDYTKEDEVMQGSGLGLPLVLEITQSYGGSVEVIENEFSPGASFLIKLSSKDVGIKKSMKKAEYHKEKSFETRPITKKHRISNVKKRKSVLKKKKIRKKTTGRKKVKKTKVLHKSKKIKKKAKRILRAKKSKRRAKRR